ncbi:hypothetical protein CGRA01v4_03672 [Colletotrichum graminicola]|nr:hypothetical protein CGRA01v4_03672 [Colletotrichum graminicola]
MKPRPRVQANTTLITRYGKAETAVLEIGEDARRFEVRHPPPPPSSALVVFEPVPASRKVTNRPRRGHRHSSHDGFPLITLQGQADEPPSPFSPLALGRTNANGRYRFPRRPDIQNLPDRGRSTGFHLRSDRPPAGCQTWSRRSPKPILPVGGLLGQLQSRVRSLFARTTTSRH